MAFHALEAALDLVRAVRAPHRTVRDQHAPLADQLLRAAQSVPLNVAEGSALSRGRARNHYRIAAGSAREVEAALRTALALEFLDDAAVADALRLCDRLGAMLWRLTH